MIHVTKQHPLKPIKGHLMLLSSDVGELSYEIFTPGERLEVFEDDCLIDPMYFDILHELYQHYEEVEVDIVSLDKDHQGFLEAYGEVDKLREEYMQQGQQVFEAYEQLLDDSEDVYRRVDIVQMFMHDYCLYFETALRSLAYWFLCKSYDNKWKKSFYYHWAYLP